MEIIYQDKRILVAIKPAGVLSTDVPGGMPDRIRTYLGDEKASVRTVHRLDQAVSGLMVFARSREAARILSAQIESRTFQKEYLAVLHEVPENLSGTLQDLLMRDKQRRMTFVTDLPQKGAQEAVLDYQVLQMRADKTLVRIQLHTGRTHQIRVQFSSRGLPLCGDRKYGIPDGYEEIALWSHRLCFQHPETGEVMDFSLIPPAQGAWEGFSLDKPTEIL